MTEDLKQHDADFIDEPESPAAAAALGREVRFGLSLLGLLLAMLAAAVYVKMGMPGLPWGRQDVAAVDAPADTAEAPAENTAHAEPAVQAPVPAQEDTSSTQPLWNSDSYAGRHEAAPPTDAPLPVGNVEPVVADQSMAQQSPVEPQSNPFAAVDQAPPGAIDQVSAETEAIPENGALCQKRPRRRRRRSPRPPCQRPGPCRRLLAASRRSPTNLPRRCSWNRSYRPTRQPRTRRWWLRKKTKRMDRRCASRG